MIILMIMSLFLWLHILSNVCVRLFVFLFHIVTILLFWYDY